MAWEIGGIFMFKPLKLFKSSFVRWDTLFVLPANRFIILIISQSVVGECSGCNPRPGLDVACLTHTLIRTCTLLFPHFVLPGTITDCHWHIYSSLSGHTEGNMGLPHEVCPMHPPKMSFPKHSSSHILGSNWSQMRPNQTPGYGPSQNWAVSYSSRQKHTRTCWAASSGGYCASNDLPKAVCTCVTHQLLQLPGNKALQLYWWALCVSHGLVPL